MGREIGKGGGWQGCPLSPTLINIYLKDLMKNCFLSTGDVNIGGRRIKFIRFPDDIVLLAENERMLRNILMELNDRFEDYGMKININKTKALVIGRTPKKIDMRIKDESVEQMDSFKYLGCNNSSNLNCCQEIKQRIAISKEAYKRKSSIFCGPLEKELRKRPVKYFV